ncbi:MAG: hypothetical protein AAF560_00735 [Acidobacteriota bacterium]
MSIKSIVKTLMFMMSLAVLWMLPATEAQAGRWPDEAQYRFQDESGQEYDVYVCERRFLTFQCRPGEIRMVPV